MSFLPLLSSLKTAEIRSTAKVEKDGKTYEFYGCEKARFCETTGEIVAVSQSHSTSPRYHVKFRAPGDSQSHFEMYDLNCEAAVEIDGNTLRFVFPITSKWTIHPFVLPNDQIAKWTPLLKDINNGTTLKCSLNKWQIKPVKSISAGDSYSHHFYGDVSSDDGDQTDIYASAGTSKLHLVTNMPCGTSSSHNPFVVFLNGPLFTECDASQKTTFNVFPSAQYTVHFIVRMNNKHALTKIH
jgi:hypothetical protein